MNSKISGIFIVLLLCGLSVGAQGTIKYWIGFSDKMNSPYLVSQPEEFLSQRSIERRQRNEVVLSEQDFPVNPWYVDSLQQLGYTVHYTSRWLNGAVVSTSDTLLLPPATLQKPYVREIKDLNTPSAKGRRVLPSIQTYDVDHDDFIRRRRLTGLEGIYGKSAGQAVQIGADKLHARGYKGDGILIAVLDAGFRSVDTMNAFRHLYQENRVLMAADFVGNNPYSGSTHGTGVLGTIAGKIEGKYLGTAPEATYMLVRTEDAATEFPVELYNWLAGAELADSAGADIINSSLGYHHFDNPKYDFSYSDMDGRTTLISIAATMAAARGILVITSAGNLGTQSWGYISTPADADSILAIGAVNAAGEYAPFSSRGPTADKRIKPEVVATGWMTFALTTSGNVIQGNGTSYSSPILAGAAACLMQSVPGATALSTRQAIIESGSQFKQPDSLLGYGIPNMALAHLILSNAVIHSIDIDNNFTVMPNPFDDYVEVAFKSESEGRYSLQLFNSNGKRVLNLEKLQKVEGINYYRIESMNTLKKGVYVIRIITNEKVYTQKVVKI